MLADKPTELSRIKLKTWTRQPVPLISQRSAHLAPLSVDFRTWLCRYTCLLLLISMLWYRQAISKSKGDKLCSSVQCRIWTRSPDTNSPADWMLADKPTELSRIKLKTWTRQPVPMISEHPSHLAPLLVDFRTCLWRYTCFEALAKATRQPVPMISERSAQLAPLSVDFRTWLCRYTCLLLLISMLLHRQAIFKSKGDKLCSSA